MVGLDRRTDHLRCQEMPLNRRQYTLLDLGHADRPAF
jgi:hypothetical protein